MLEIVRGDSVGVILAQTGLHPTETSAIAPESVGMVERAQPDLGESTITVSDRRGVDSIVQRGP